MVERVEKSRPEHCGCAVIKKPSATLLGGFMRCILIYIPMLISFGALADLPPDEAEIASAAMTVAATSEDATAELPLHVLEKSSFPTHHRGSPGLGSIKS